MNMMPRPAEKQKAPPRKNRADKPVVVSDDDVEMDGPDYADIFSKPPTVALTHLVMGMVIQLFMPLKLPAVLPWVLPGMALIAAGVWVALRAMREFKAHETTVPTDEPASALVTSGLYRRSRNPIYTGLCLIYLGIGVMLSNVWVLGLFVPFFLYLNNHVIPREEEYLGRKFGAAYRDYCKQAGRWF